MVRITGHTELYGILGYPLKHTLSPAMHNEAFKNLGRNAIYLPFEVEETKFYEVLKGLSHIIKGANVTVPHKESLNAFLNGKVDDHALHIGAVNTLYIEGSEWRGANTDWLGFKDSLLYDYGQEMEDKNILILGAGGSSRACAYAAIKAEAKKVILANRTLSKCEKIIEDFQLISEKTTLVSSSIEKEILMSHLEDADIIVNTTSIGLKQGDVHYASFEGVKESCFVYDLIYGIETDFLNKASLKRLSFGDGKGMLVRQGYASSLLWTGQEGYLDSLVKGAGFSYERGKIR